MSGAEGGQLILGVDFDGTCVEHAFPQVGREAPGCGDTLRWAVGAGIRLVLWTVRSGIHLKEAVDWFRIREIALWGVNENPEQHTWSTSPKAFCHRYVDDAAIGAPMHMPWGPNGGKVVVDWSEVRTSLERLLEARR